MNNDSPHHRPEAYGIGIHPLITRWLHLEVTLMDAGKITERSIVRALRRELQESINIVAPPPDTKP